MIGRLDTHGLMPCMRNSDLYVLRIAESEGVMNLIRTNEKLLGRQLGTTVIFDLEGLSTEMLWMPAIKVITSMLSQLQKLKECIDEDVLYENWGGTRPAETPYGHIRTGGKVPRNLW
uniref:CRAL-TRIO domain-containing protein n=1 Tax=Parascaris equorum TaxID=6256 RepID=A0A914RKT4_PAREQ